MRHWDFRRKRETPRRRETERARRDWVLRCSDTEEREQAAQKRETLQQEREPYCHANAFSPILPPFPHLLGNTKGASGHILHYPSNAPPPAQIQPHRPKNTSCDRIGCQQDQLDFSDELMANNSHVHLDPTQWMDFSVELTAYSLHKPQNGWTSANF